MSSERVKVGYVSVTPVAEIWTKGSPDYAHEVSPFDGVTLAAPVTRRR